MDNKSDIIKSFLKAPLDRDRFNEFYALMYGHSIGYFGYLRRIGYILPVETGDRDNQLSDLAIDILGTLLRCDGARPFYLIFECFERQGISDFDQAAPDDLYSCMISLLHGHIHQELSKLLKSMNPQIDNLKRRFKDILKGENYGSLNIASDTSECVYLLKYEDALRENMASSSGDFLLWIAEEAYLHCNSRKAWCNMIFEMINDQTDYQNFTLKHELLGAVVSINSRQMEIDSIPMHRPRSLMHESLHREAQKCKSETLEWAKNGILSRFDKKSKINKSDAVGLMTALEKYLNDFCEHGDTDPLPRYFRESMPDETHRMYLSHYKYIFETLADKSLEYLKDILRKRATILGLGDY
jgi:hypothetical protein